MSRFTGPLVIEEVKPGRLWRLREAIVYEVGAEGSGASVTVPAGFETDGATIPSPFRVALAVWGTYGRAACLHDYAYSRLRTGAPDGLLRTRRVVNDRPELRRLFAFASIEGVRLDYRVSGRPTEAREIIVSGGAS